MKILLAMLVVGLLGGCVAYPAGYYYAPYTYYPQPAVYYAPYYAPYYYYVR